jgi:adenine-specific DNA-methyltransferase
MTVCGVRNADITLDFFAGSASTAHAAIELAAELGETRPFICVQLPEPTAGGSEERKAGFETISDIAKERIRRAARGLKELHVDRNTDFGFRLFKLNSSNINAWLPNREDLVTTLEQVAEHLKADRTDQDILCELLIKLGLGLTVPIETKTIANKAVHSIGAGVLIVCLDKKIEAKVVEPLAHGIADWRKELAPAGETTVVFRDDAFADDVAKTNLTAILQQHGLDNVRSL